ncbi:unnamed protein product [Nippostrongylus brasiliensis]|uniref:BZIP domain-containing protein n=1 Tax=Nippostrongylus brasiliensis TaxID=27835 RepID=A0A158QWT6_NIPBR|nr:unnamed protein product [Nippostrongylus brasiliensis]
MLVSFDWVQSTFSVTTTTSAGLCTMSTTVGDEIRLLGLQEHLQSFSSSFKHDDNDESVHSNLDGEVDLELFQNLRKVKREYPAGRFLKRELEYIAETYCNNYETFYHSTVNGGKDKDAIAKKKALLNEMAEHISQLGEEHRTAEQQMIADVIENTIIEPIKPKPIAEQNGIDEAVVVDTSCIDVPTAGSSMEVSPPPVNRHNSSSPVETRRKKRRMSQRDFPTRPPFDDFRYLRKEKRRVVEDDMKYARAKLEAVTAERDYWMAKIDVLDLERQFWMREIERSLSNRF